MNTKKKPSYAETAKAKQAELTQATPVAEPVKQLFLEDLLYVIEENHVMPSRGSDKAEAWRKIEETMKKVTKVGQAFIVKSKNSYMVGILAKEKFPELAFRVTTIKDNPDYKRVFRIA
jgi:hypothetical protein